MEAPFASFVALKIRFQQEITVGLGAEDPPGSPLGWERSCC